MRSQNFAEPSFPLKETLYQIGMETDTDASKENASILRAILVNIVLNCSIIQWQ